MNSQQDRTSIDRCRSEEKQKKMFEYIPDLSAARKLEKTALPLRAGFLWIPAKLEPLITTASPDIWHPLFPFYVFIFFLSRRMPDTAYQRLDFRLSLPPLRRIPQRVASLLELRFTERVFRRRKNTAVFLIGGIRQLTSKTKRSRPTILSPPVYNVSF